jgi:hypothetical protein
MFADIIVIDRDDRPIALVEVKPGVATREELQDWTRLLDHSHPSILFGIFVDLEDIYLFRRDVREGTFAPVAKLGTREILRHYDPDFAGKDTRYGSIQFFLDLVETLVTAWLRDLAYHWKSEHPPGVEELAPTGLLEMIEGGFAGKKSLVVERESGLA